MKPALGSDARRLRPRDSDHNLPDDIAGLPEREGALPDMRVRRRRKPGSHCGSSSVQPIAQAGRRGHALGVAVEQPAGPAYGKGTQEIPITGRQYKGQALGQHFARHPIVRRMGLRLATPPCRQTPIPPYARRAPGAR
jgi:hypothetical protein